MEVSGAIVQQPSCFFRRSSDDIFSIRSFSGVGTRNHLKFSSSSIALCGVRNYGFREEGHLQYYECRGKSMEEKQKKKVKQELKLLKGRFSGDLSASSSQLGFFFHSDQPKLVSERTDELVRQLQKLKAEHKELKRKRKLEKVKLKAERIKTMVDSSSSSSESCDNEGRYVINMSHHRRRQATVSNPFMNGWQNETVQESKLTLPCLQTQELKPALQNSNLQLDYPPLPTKPAEENLNSLPDLPFLQTDQAEKSLNSRLDLSNRECCPRTARNGEESGWRVEVCMGNKCRKAGAAMVMEEFERVVGVEGAVCGCKCMGKCREGPNVRVLSSKSMDTGAYLGSVDSAKQTLAGPLCIGVGLEDVDRIVADFLGPMQKDSKLAPAT